MKDPISESMKKEFADLDIEQVTQAIIADDPDMSEHTADLREALGDLKAGRYGRVYYPSETAQARHRTGMTQQEFAEVMGVSVRTLQNWEQGRRKPSGAAATLLKIAARHPEAIRELRSQP